MENIDIDIDKEISGNIDIDKISNRLEFGILNRARLRPMLTPSARLLTVFPSTMPTPLDTPTTLESSPVSITAMDVSLAMEPSVTVASMVDTTEAMLDTLEPTTANFTLSSHHNFA